MSGLTPYEKERLSICGYPNYKKYIENFSKLLDESLGYHIDAEMEEFIAPKTKFKKMVKNHRIRLEGMSDNYVFKGRDAWDLFKEGWSFKHAIEDTISFWFPDTREEYIDEVKKYK